MGDVIAGIDLGTTNSLIGVMDAGFPILLADREGVRLTPSVVHFGSGDGCIVGRPAARMRALQPDRTVYSAKRLMGLRGDELGETDADLDYAVVRAAGAEVKIDLQRRVLAPEEVAAEILRKLKADAETAIEQPVTRAVITVPAYFNDAQRNATRRAGELAGFTVERIINEPTAAALAYGLDKLKSRARIAVYDLGGGTFDISLLELNNGVFEVLATNGNTRLGGDDIDQAIVARMLRELQLPAPDNQTLARLREAAVIAKHRLSSDESTTIELPFIAGARSAAIALTRDELERISRPVIDRTRAHCERVLADAKLGVADLDDVILVGGMTRMPLVRRTVEEIFGRPPNVSQNPDEAVALGATIQAGILAGAVRDILLLDVTPLSLGIETFGGLMNVIIPRNSTIPVRAGEMFTTAVTNQRSMRIKILQGEREMARDNWTLGEFDIEFEPAPKGVPRVGVQFEIDADGILHVLARDTRSGQEKTVELTSAVDVSDEAVEAMIADSLDHAFDDMNERVWTEAKIKADELLAAVENAFRLLGAAPDSAERAELEPLTQALRAALDAGTVAQLKEATAALDAATEGMAARLLERALQTSPPAD